MRRPRPEESHTVRGAGRGTLSPPPSVTSTSTTSPRIFQRTRIVPSDERTGVAHGVGEQLGGDDLGLVDELVGRCRGSGGRRRPRGAPCRPRRARAGARRVHDDAVDAGSGRLGDDEPGLAGASGAAGVVVVLVVVTKCGGHAAKPTERRHRVEHVRRDGCVMMTSTPRSRQRSTSSSARRRSRRRPRARAAGTARPALRPRAQHPHVEADGAARPWGGCRPT